MNKKRTTTRVSSYHFAAEIVKRSDGRSVVAMAAYRAGVRLADRQRGVFADYRARRGIFYSEIIVPQGGARWLADREVLWNAVEAMERRRDAQLARELNISLPHELTDAQRLELTRKFVREQFVALGMVADIAIHRPVTEKGDDPRNFHAHILLTLRQAEANGLRRVKTREWNSDAMLVAWRKAWADYQNEMLRACGQGARVDHRSLFDQRSEAVARGDVVRATVLDREPEIHVGPKARKAGLANAPQSRDRVVGPVRLRAGFKARRIRRYEENDRGSRGEVNVSRLLSNARSFSALSARTEIRLARMRRRQALIERSIAKHRAMLMQPERRVVIPSRRAAEAAARYEARQKLLHAIHRRQQVVWWIRQLEILFRSLLAVREQQLGRRALWVRRLERWRVLEFLSSDGGRARAWD